MFFDAVLDVNCQPLHNGPPEDIVRWLRQNPGACRPENQVCLGETMDFMSIPAYVQIYGSEAGVLPALDVFARREKDIRLKNNRPGWWEVIKGWLTATTSK